jgi:hypothetical protein
MPGLKVITNTGRTDHLKGDLVIEYKDGALLVYRQGRHGPNDPPAAVYAADMWASAAADDIEGLTTERRATRAR